MSLRIALLGLLSASGPASGYDLTKKFEQSINHVWQAGHSQIYPELAKMVADGLVTVGAEGSRGRKTYTITSEGTAELRRWLVERVHPEPVRIERALQAFLLPLLEPHEALEVLGKMAAASRAYLDSLEALRAAHHTGDGPGRPRLGHYSLDLGIMHAQTTLAWVDKTVSAINAHQTDLEPPSEPSSSA